MRRKKGEVLTKSRASVLCHALDGVVTGEAHAMILRIGRICLNQRISHTARRFGEQVGVEEMLSRLYTYFSLAAEFSRK